MSKKSTKFADASIEDSLTMIDGELVAKAVPTKELLTRTTGSAAATRVQGRVYSQAQMVDHDLFKLKVATMRRDISLDRDQTMEDNVEHCHYFHSVDAAGRPQKMASMIGGHFHEMTVIPSKDGSVPEVICGPALVWISKRVGRKGSERVAAPYDMDEHTHEVIYMGSNKIKLREPNIEFAKHEAAVTSRQEQSLPGIIG